VRHHNLTLQTTLEEQTSGMVFRHIHIRVHHFRAGVIFTGSWVRRKVSKTSYWYVGIGVDITNPSLEYILITVNDLSEINGASWKIQINH